MDEKSVRRFSQMDADTGVRIRRKRFSFFFIRMLCASAVVRVGIAAPRSIAILRLRQRLPPRVKRERMARWKEEFLPQRSQRFSQRARWQTMYFLFCSFVNSVSSWRALWCSLTSICPRSVVLPHTMSFLCVLCVFFATFVVPLGPLTAQRLHKEFHVAALRPVITTKHLNTTPLPQNSTNR